MVFSALFGAWIARVRAEGVMKMGLPAKARTYLRYFRNHFREGDLVSLANLGKLALSGSTFPQNRVVRTGVGAFYVRGGTNDLLFTNPAYEWAVRSWTRRHAREFDAFLDVGACIGDYSVLLAKRGLRCCAFEPVPDNYRSLRINVLLNNLEDRIRTFNVGCGSRDHTARFRVDPRNTGATGLAEPGTGGEVEVAIRPLDALRPELDLRPDDSVLVKIDAEGMELEVLEGARETLREFDRITVILETILVREHAVVERLQQLGDFAVTRLDASNIVARKR